MRFISRVDSMCLCRVEDWLNAFSHTWHLYGFSPLWVLLCPARRTDVVNRLPQTVHSNGFSPEWVLLCTARSLLLPQHLPHYVHLYLPVWIFIWWRRDSQMNNVSHTEYMNTYFRQYVFNCAYSNLYDVCTVCDTLYTNTALSCQDVDVLSYRYYQLLSWPQINSLQIHNAASTS